jgi:ABC-type bacteriocin/lantibiotic exporter with double-glycine peptidase domain
VRVGDIDQADAPDPGLSALVMLLRFYGVGVEAEQLRHRFGQSRIGVSEMIRCAKDLGLKARSYRTTWKKLAATALPGIAALRDGGFLILAKAGDDQALVQWPLEPRPALMSRAELEAVWDGQIVLMTRRAGLVELSRRFDITWFLGAIHKYRFVLSKVLLASFFLQLFASLHCSFKLLLTRCWCIAVSAPLMFWFWDWSQFRYSKRFSPFCAPMSSPIPRTGSMLSLAPVCFVICWHCQSLTSKRDVWVTRWHE